MAGQTGSVGGEAAVTLKLAGIPALHALQTAFGSLFVCISRGSSTLVPAGGGQLARAVLPLPEWLHPGG